MNITMNIEEKNRRCDAAALHYHPDQVGFLCRVYGRWVRDCYDCAFNVHGSHTGVINYNRKSDGSDE